MQITTATIEKNEIDQKKEVEREEELPKIDASLVEKIKSKTPIRYVEVICHGMVLLSNQ